MGELDLSFSFQKILQISDISNKFKKKRQSDSHLPVKPALMLQGKFRDKYRDKYSISEKNYSYLFSRGCIFAFSRIDKNRET